MLAIAATRGYPLPGSRFGERGALATKARASTLVAYAVGQISPSVKGNLLASFLLYYYNQVLGLSAGLAGLALAMALVVDAVSDPLMGYVSDHTRSRLGRRHPYIYASLLPSAAFYYLLLSVRFGSSQAALFWQLLLLVTGLRLAWTFYQVPREALGAEISKDYEQRNQLHGLNSFFGWIGGAGIAYATQAWFLKGSYDNEAGYHGLAAWGAGILLLTSALFAIGTHREIPHLEPPRQGRPPGMREAVREILETLNHRSWLMLFFAGMVFSIYVGLVQGLGVYFNRFFWDWAPSDVAIFAITDLTAALGVSLFAGRLAGGFDKKQLALRLFAISIAIGPLLLVLRLADLHLGLHLLPPNGPKYGPLWWIMLLHSLVTSSIGVLAWILVGSMTADVVEDSQRQTGRRSEGLFFAGPNLVQKCISGLGFVVKGVLLTAVGFEAAAGDAEKAAATAKLAAILVALGVLLPSLSLWILSHYEITRDTHERNLAQLGYGRPAQRDS